MSKLPRFPVLSSVMLLSAFLLSVCAVVTAGEDSLLPLDWENEQMIGLNKEPDTARSRRMGTSNRPWRNREASPFYQSLNGTWKFNGSSSRPTGPWISTSPPST